FARLWIACKCGILLTGGNFRILDTLHQIFASHLVYTYTVTNFGDIVALITETWSV
ncbi:hypothetical protein CERSUDRAFT_27689, partial [Gelatoporia subvermispora B]